MKSAATRRPANSISFSGNCQTTANNITNFFSDLVEGRQGDPRDEQPIPLQLRRQHVLRVRHQDVHGHRRRSIRGASDRPEGRDELGVRPQHRQSRRAVKSILVPGLIRRSSSRSTNRIISDTFFAENAVSGTRTWGGHRWDTVCPNTFSKKSVSLALARVLPGRVSSPPIAPFRPFCFREI